jgi:hypothetical protein
LLRTDNIQGSTSAKNRLAQERRALPNGSEGLPAERLAKEGMKREEIAKRRDDGLASVYRVLAEQKRAHAKVHAANI